MRSVDCWHSVFLRRTEMPYAHHQSVRKIIRLVTEQKEQRKTWICRSSRQYAASDCACVCCFFQLPILFRDSAVNVNTQHESWSKLDSIFFLFLLFSLLFRRTRCNAFAWLKFMLQVLSCSFNIVNASTLRRKQFRNVKNYESTYRTFRFRKAVFLTHIIWWHFPVELIRPYEWNDENKTWILNYFGWFALVIDYFWILTQCLYTLWACPIRECHLRQRCKIYYFHTQHHHRISNKFSMMSFAPVRHTEFINE